MAGQSALLAAGEVSAVELVDVLLARIERLDRRLGAFRSVFAAQARAEAAAADRARAGGDDRPLLGVPIAVKDNVDVAGAPTALGTGARPPAATGDGPLVARLRAAGLVVLGKTTLPEYALWAFTESPTSGSTHNPWDLERGTGGSSGGSAAAVAAGLVPAATATDGGGSIRIPAASCGLVGLKPGSGLLPVEPPGHWHGLTASGFLTRTVADTALLYEAVAGPLADAGSSWLRAAHPPARRLRIAMSLRSATPVLGRPAPAAVAAIDATADVLRGLGHTVEHRDPPYGAFPWGGFLPRYLGGLADDHARLGRPAEVEPRTRRLAKSGRAARGPAIGVSRRAGARMASRIAHAMAGYDAWLLPAIPGPPPQVGLAAGAGAVRTIAVNSRLAAFTAPWNVTDQPAISVPAFPAGAAKPPLGVQFVGPVGGEALLLALAAELEAAVGWPDRRPPFAAG